MLQSNNQAVVRGLPRQRRDQLSTASLCAVPEAPAPASDVAVLHQLIRPLLTEGDCRQVAQNLLEAFGSVGGVLGADGEHLAGVVGGPVAYHLGTLQRVLQHVLRERLEDRPVIGSWTALEEYLSVALRHERTEKLLVLFLDRKNGLIRDEVMQEGTVDHVPAYPREIAKRALQLDASAVIMVQNHPSGDPTPSKGDVEMTRRVIAALTALDIAVHDHAIVGPNKVISLRQTGAV